MQSQYDVIIIGAGAAGLLCAIEAGKHGRSVLLLEKANKAGKKILISGGGRCNFTNLYTEPEAYISNNPHFCKSALSRFTQWDFIALVDSHEINWHEKSLGQLFCDDKAKAITTMLFHQCQKNNVTIQTDTRVEKIMHKTEFSVSTNSGNYDCQSLIIATGGPSIPRMGSTDFGLQVAKQFGLHSIPFRPALVPFTFAQKDLSGILKDLAGVSLKVCVECNQQSFTEGMLFTHRGLSGPAILQISSYWKKGDTLRINLLPELDLFTWLIEEKQHHPNKMLKTSLSEKLPKKLVQRFCETLFEDSPIGQLPDIKIQKISDTLHSWAITPSGTEGMRTAEVCTGGVDTAELSSKTFESKKQPGLYFIGETIDVTGHLGGYNFQWAWASGWCCGQQV